MGWSALVLMAWTTAWAAPSARVCHDIRQQYDQPQTTVDETVAYVRNDTRAYDEGVVACLCATGVHPEVQQAARRNHLHQRHPEDGQRFEVAMDDALTSPMFQVATLLGRRWRGEVAGLRRFALQPTAIAGPPWFDWGAMVTVLSGNEFAGLQTADDWFAFGIVDPLPRGPLDVLASGDALATASLSGARGFFPRFVWMDATRPGDDRLRLAWLVHDIAQQPPHAEVARDELVFVPVPGALVAACDDPGAIARRWKGRLAWPPGRIATIVTGAVVGAAAAGVAIHEFTQFDPDSPPDVQSARINRNSVFGIVSIAGGAMAVVGFAIPPKVWWR